MYTILPFITSPAGAVANGRGSVLRRRCDMSYTSGLWRTSCFFYNGPYCGMNFCNEGPISLNLLIYLKVEQSSISYYQRHNFDQLF